MDTILTDCIRLLADLYLEGLHARWLEGEFEARLAATAGLGDE